MTERDPAVADALERTRPRAAAGPDWDDVVRRTAGAPGPAPRRPVRPALRWAPGLAGGVAIAALLGVMAVRQGDAPPSAAPKGVTGVEALVDVTSTREGQTDEQAAERMERVLVDRARIQGMTGFAVERSGTRLSVFVPRTQNPGWVRLWLPVLPGPEVFDLNRSVVARGTDPIAVLRRAASMGGTGPMVHHIAVRGRTAATSGMNGPFASRGEAEAAVATFVSGVDARAVRIVAVPASVRLVIASRGRGFEFLALGDPLVSAGDAVVRASGNRVDIEVVAAARERVASAVAAGARPVIVDQRLLEIPFVRFDASGGALVFRARYGTWARELAFSAAGGAADALAVVETSRAVGPVPARDGTPVRLPERTLGAFDLPEWRVRGSSVRRVVSLRAPGGGFWWVWSGRTAGGWETAGAVVGDRRLISVGSCEVEPRRPLLSTCGGGITLGRRILVGRAGASVRAVTVLTEDGVRVDGAAANGFFLAVVPARAGTVRALIARDREGRELGRLTRDDPLQGITLAGLG